MVESINAENWVTVTFIQFNGILEMMKKHDRSGDDSGRRAHVFECTFEYVDS